MTDDIKIKGEITNEYTIWCGMCAYWDQQSGPRKLVVTYWKQKGWHRTLKNGWLCPNCDEHLKLMKKLAK